MLEALCTARDDVLLERIAHGVHIRDNGAPPKLAAFVKTVVSVKPSHRNLGTIRAVHFHPTSAPAATRGARHH